MQMSPASGVVREPGVAGEEREAEQTQHARPGATLSRKGRGFWAAVLTTWLGGPQLMAGVGPLVPCVQGGDGGREQRHRQPGGHGPCHVRLSPSLRIQSQPRALGHTGHAPSGQGPCWSPGPKGTKRGHRHVTGTWYLSAE